MILAFVGLKMILDRWVHISTPLSLGVIVAVLAFSVAVSVRIDGRARAVGFDQPESVER